MANIKPISSIYTCMRCSRELYVLRGESFKKHPDYCFCGVGMIVKRNTGAITNKKIKTGDQKPKRFTLGSVNRPKLRRKRK